MFVGFVGVLIEFGILVSNQHRRPFMFIAHGIFAIDGVSVTDACTYVLVERKCDVLSACTY